MARAAAMRWQWLRSRGQRSQAITASATADSERSDRIVAAGGVLRLKYLTPA
jgi:hypothetical protein